MNDYLILGFVVIAGLSALRFYRKANPSYRVRQANEHGKYIAERRTFLRWLPLRHHHRLPFPGFADYDTAHDFSSGIILFPTEAAARACNVHKSAIYPQIQNYKDEAPLALYN